MTFPTLKNKHKHDALFNPTDYIAYKKLDKSKFPKKIIFLYQSSIFKYFLRKYRGKYIKVDFFKGRSIYVSEGVGVIYLHGIGAPYAGVFMDELIAAGVTSFISMGTAGGLQEEGVFVCTKAIRDEGTSRHYLKQSKYAYPSIKLTKELESTMSKENISFRRGVSWTIDAPFRETKVEVKKYKKEGVVTVEMEAAALFAIAKYRCVDIASVFVVSDVMGETKWTPQFHHVNLKKNLNLVFDAAFHTLQNRK